MTSRNLKRFETALNAERRRAVRALSQLNADSSTLREEDIVPVGDLADSSDAAAAAFVREVESVEAAAQLALLQRIDAALELVHDRPDDYGRCERCGGPIASERLALLPWTRRCRLHANGHRPARALAGVG